MANLISDDRGVLRAPHDDDDSEHELPEVEEEGNRLDLPFALAEEEPAGVSWGDGSSSLPPPPSAAATAAGEEKVGGAGEALRSSSSVGPLSRSAFWAADAAAAAASTTSNTFVISRSGGGGGGGGSGGGKRTFDLAASLAATSVSTAEFGEPSSPGLFFGGGGGSCSGGGGSALPLCASPRRRRVAVAVDDAHDAHDDNVRDSSSLPWDCCDATAADVGGATDASSTVRSPPVGGGNEDEGGRGGGAVICGASGGASGEVAFAEDSVSGAASSLLLRGSGATAAMMETVLIRSDHPAAAAAAATAAAAGEGNDYFAARSKDVVQTDAVGAASVGFSQLMLRAEEGGENSGDFGCGGGGGNVPLGVQRTGSGSSWVLHDPSQREEEGGRSALAGLDTGCPVGEGRRRPSRLPRRRSNKREGGGTAISGGLQSIHASFPPTHPDGGEAIVPGSMSRTILLAASAAMLRAERSPSVVERIDRVSFRVETRILSMASSSASVADVLDAVSDPEALGAWFGPVLGGAVYVTRSDRCGGSSASPSSVAAASSSANGVTSTEGTNRQDDQREYDGEWIEASASGGLRLPGGDDGADFVSTGCVRRVWARTRSFLGFPTYGRISMFVERRAGRIGMTVGPYGGGGMVVSHSIEVREDESDARAGGSGVIVSDTVRLDRSEEASSSVSIGSVGGGVSSCCGLLTGPSAADFAAQAALSLDRLKCLIEEGGEIYSSGSLILDEVSGHGACQPLLGP